jgi:hypothetical protein
MVRDSKEALGADLVLTYDTSRALDYNELKCFYRLGDPSVTRPGELDFTLLDVQPEPLKEYCPQERLRKVR